MTNEEKVNHIIGTLKNVIQSEFGIPADRIGADMPLHKEGVSLNSMQMIEFTVAFETHFGIDLPPEVLVPENYTSLAKLASAINGYIEA